MEDRQCGGFVEPDDFRGVDDGDPICGDILFLKGAG
jgi:hypothetical protein